MDDVFLAAAARWESIIVKDVPNVSDSTDWTFKVVNTTYSDRPNGPIVYKQAVDDVSR